MNRVLSAVGIVGTAIYLLGLALLCSGRLPELKAMPLNNLGDFLAGAFGPLAILWLVLGFFQQGIELRQNTEALRLQADELQKSAEQQRQLVEVSRAQVEAEFEVIRYERDRAAKAARPQLIPQGVGAGFNGAEARYETNIKNLGNHATAVSFTFDPPMKFQSRERTPTWSHGETLGLAWIYATGVAMHPASLTIAFIDASGSPGSQVFSMNPVPGSAHPMVELVPHEALYLPVDRHTK
jgi:hypothetical protein